MLKFRIATVSDIDIIVEICSQARNFQRECGNVQWTNGYPTIDVITRDVQSCKGYVVEDAGVLAGYCVVDTDGDIEYDSASHIWANQKPYAAIHRLAVADNARGKGLSKWIFKQIEKILREKGINVIKVDTGLKNEPIQRLMKSIGFSNRGEITFSWGLRIAYEKEIAQTLQTSDY